MTTESTIYSWHMQLLLFLLYILSCEPRCLCTRLRNEGFRISALFEFGLDLVRLASPAMRLVALLSLLCRTHTGSLVVLCGGFVVRKALLVAKIVLDLRRSITFFLDARSALHELTVLASSYNG